MATANDTPNAFNRSPSEWHELVDGQCDRLFDAIAVLQAAQRMLTANVGAPIEVDEAVALRRLLGTAERQVQEAIEGFEL